MLIVTPLSAWTLMTRIDGWKSWEYSSSLRSSGSWLVSCLSLLSKRGKLTENQIFKYILIGVGLTCVLILPENFSTAFMLFGVCFLMMFIGQLPFGKLAKLAGILMLAYPVYRGVAVYASQLLPPVFAGSIRYLAGAFGAFLRRA